MADQFGRISGPLLANNLLRDGVDLAFESTLLYLNVSTGTIGINTDSPSRTLTVNGTTHTTNLIVDTQATIANFTISANNIRNFTSSIYIRPDQTTAPQIYAVKYATSNLEFSSNLIKNTVTDSNIEITPVTGGRTNIRTSILVNGGLHSTGSITWDGNIQIGNDSNDNVVFSADVNSDIIPNNPGGVESYNLGNSTNKRWNITYTNIVNSSNFYPDLASIGTLYAGNIQISGNTITNSVAGNPIQLTPNGTGVALFNNQQYIDRSNILNLTNSAFTLTNLNTGYVKISGTGGVVIPFGTTIEQPASPELGMLRYNTDLGYAEVWSGSAWTPAKGVAPQLTEAEVYDIMDEWTLILG
ncbi:hypothetical protein UFOVP181_355 [uncultured Caudovirales phage]|uniref:Uncharacterized protein n=1 Tax=uncultured Caudovirales phage TaxID=2100421 RepID=A0A6J5KY52_9CAUD|nr:hypothetical protein UFOVP57_284 [uncultured Caudovirales phage]CAB5209202.1 hypothetical protein UFOVP181_355 [uncultured Caudovirales phage]